MSRLPRSGLAQWLMRTPAVPSVYERWWRPALGRVAMGRHGPGMAGEHRLAAELLALSPGQVVLDVACGTGAFTRGFGRLVGSSGLAVGLDASRPMLARAAAAGAGGGSVAYVRADAVHPPLADGSLDAVCCFAALHLFDDPEAELSSFARLLRPGGRLAVLTSARRDALPLALVDASIGVVSGMRMFGRGEVAALMRDRGLDIETERVHGVVQVVSGRRRR